MQFNIVVFGIGILYKIKMLIIYNRYENKLYICEIKIDYKKRAMKLYFLLNNVKVNFLK